MENKKKISLIKDEEITETNASIENTETVEEAPVPEKKVNKLYNLSTFIFALFGIASAVFVAFASIFGMLTLFNIPFTLGNLSQFLKEIAGISKVVDNLSATLRFVELTITFLLGVIFAICFIIKAISTIISSIKLFKLNNDYDAQRKTFKSYAKRVSKTLGVAVSITFLSALFSNRIPKLGIGVLVFAGVYLVLHWTINILFGKEGRMPIKGMIFYLLPRLMIIALTIVLSVLFVKQYIFNIIDIVQWSAVFSGGIAGFVSKMVVYFKFLAAGMVVQVCQCAVDGLATNRKKRIAKVKSGVIGNIVFVILMTLLEVIGVFLAQGTASGIGGMIAFLVAAIVLDIAVILLVDEFIGKASSETEPKVKKEKAPKKKKQKDEDIDD